jgi:hypothetical protein
VIGPTKVAADRRNAAKIGDRPFERGVSVEAVIAKSTGALVEMAGNFLGEIRPLGQWHRARVQDPLDVRG